ncbi:MAG: hypothetical protein LBF77_05930 [Spirochaetaceae bacterium]|jgi:hypothetical protein|nr:hypothetical protein [Spirochaetaceae bacterium]
MNIHHIKSSGAILFLFMGSLFSCLSAPEGDLPEQRQVSEAPQASLLPLVSGWYLYDFECTFKGIEDEYNFAQSTGIKMAEEITVRQNGSAGRIRRRHSYFRNRFFSGETVGISVYTRLCKNHAV